MLNVGSSSLTRDRTWAPARGVQSLSHRTTRKVPQHCSLSRPHPSIVGISFQNLCFLDTNSGDRRVRFNSFYPVTLDYPACLAFNPLSLSPGHKASQAGLAFPRCPVVRLLIRSSLNPSNSVLGCYRKRKHCVRKQVQNTFKVN